MKTWAGEGLTEDEAEKQNNSHLERVGLLMLVGGVTMIPGQTLKIDSYVD